MSKTLNQIFDKMQSDTTKNFIRNRIKGSPDYILVNMNDEVSGNELDRRYEEIREELTQYQEFDNS